MEGAGLPATAVEVHLPLVGAIARSLSRGLPSTVEVDELISDGVIGLMDALRRYDPARGVGFSAYAGYRIRGAILDGLRARDPVPRRVRRRQKAVETDPWNPPPPGSLHFLPLEEALLVPADESADPEALVLEEELRQRVRLGLQALPPRDLEVVVLRLVRGLPLRTVARMLSLSITRVAEIQSRGIQRLRRYLEDTPMFTLRSAARQQEGTTVAPNRCAAHVGGSQPHPPPAGAVD